MDAKRVTLDDATVKQLSAANGNAVPLHDSKGEVIGYYLSAKEMRRTENRFTLATWTDEEIAQLEEERKNDPRPDVPHEEVVRWLKERM